MLVVRKVAQWGDVLVAQWDVERVVEWADLRGFSKVGK